MALLTQFETYALLGLFSVSMIALVLLTVSRNSASQQSDSQCDETSLDDFLVANRNIGPWRGAFSIAVSWVWAPAVFICSLQAYEHGLPGVFWFTLPNILCFFVFAYIAIKIRHIMPEGYTLPDFMWHRFKGHKGVHLAFLLIAFGYQIGAIVINAVAGGALLHLLSGIGVQMSIGIMVALALFYSLLAGLRASISTDVVQMLIILIFGFVLVPWAVFSAGGSDPLIQGLSGISGQYGNLFDPRIAYIMGIPLTISLIAGPISDQMFYQRAMAVKKDHIRAVFIRGGLLFGLVPMTLSLLGFIGVALVQNQGVIIEDSQMVAPIVIASLLPKFALYLFVLMAFAGLCSTMDSAFCGISSLGSVDVFKRYFGMSQAERDAGNVNGAEEKLNHKIALRAARLFMISGAVIGGGIAMMEPKLLWVFFIYGALASTGLVPSVVAILSSKISASTILWSLMASMAVTLPLSIYANISENVHMIVFSSASGIILSFIICAISLMRQNKDGIKLP